MSNFFEVNQLEIGKGNLYFNENAALDYLEKISHMKK